MPGTRRWLLGLGVEGFGVLGAFPHPLSLSFFALFATFPWPYDLTIETSSWLWFAVAWHFLSMASH